MDAEMTDSFSQVRAAAVDGRAHNAYYRQKQLDHLCRSLISNADALRNASATDNSLSSAETALELSLTIGAVKQYYASLDPDKLLDEEYAIANQKDGSLARRPYGIVYIEPTTHTLLYSIIVPLSAAIAAGNCAIVLLPTNLRAMSNILRRILIAALDKDTFAVATRPVEDPSILEAALLVNQTSDDHFPRSNQLCSLANSRSIAVVDRTANVQQAARELVHARFCFGGGSPYAPDIVFVNEFIKHAFLQAVLAETLKLAPCLTPSVETIPNSSKGSAASETRAGKTMDLLRRLDPDLSVVLQDVKLAIVELKTRSLELLAQKLAAPVLAIHAFRSLDDAISVISVTSNGRDLAALHFSNPKSAKYLAQFVCADVTFVNHFPRQLLIGPAFPTTHPVDPNSRYPVSLFTIPSPSFINATESVSPPWIKKWTPRDDVTTDRLWADAIEPLLVAKRRRIKLVGFFEQGLLLNAGLTLGGIIVAVASLGFHFASKRRRWLW